MCARTAVFDKLTSTDIPGAYVDVCTLPGRCTYRSTAMIFDAYSWTLKYSELLL